MEKINFAIIGPVSAGKSTFLNSIMQQTCSDMKRKKTTMLPQIYNISNDKTKIDSIETIYEKNRKSNEHILKIREDGTFNIERDFIEINHTINPLQDFIEFPKNTTYSILDMPGLNCGADSLYYDYIKKNSNKIDIFILVFDINSGLNTTDEVNIINLVIEEIKKNKHGYIHFLINKCDEININNNKIDLGGDEELNDLYSRCIKTIHKLCNDIIQKISITPLCSSKLYVIRSAINDITRTDESSIDSLIKSEFGIQQLKKLNTLEKKRKFISGLIKKGKCNDWLECTGFTLFLASCKNILQEYTTIIDYHIFQDLNNVYTSETIVKKITNIDMITFTENITNFMLLIDNRIKNLKKINKEYIISPQNLQLIVMINKGLDTTIKSCINTIIGKTLSDVESFISIIIEYSKKIVNIVSEPLHDSKKQLIEKRIELLTSDFINYFSNEIFLELYQLDLDEEIFRLSIQNTLEQDITNFKPIIIFLHSIPNTTNFVNICLERFKNFLRQDIDTQYFLECLDYILSIKEINCSDVAEIIYCYLGYCSTDIEIKIKTSLYWFNLYAHIIKNKSRKTQLVYMHILNYLNNIVKCEMYDLDLEKYEKYIEINESIFNIIIKHYDTVKYEIDNQETKIENNIMIEPINKEIEIEPESDIEYQTGEESKNDDSDDDSDNESENEIYDSDSSETVFNKIQKNSNTSVKKILKNI
jgi:GTPase Era involved in 16S rRNA processing